MMGDEQSTGLRSDGDPESGWYDNDTLTDASGDYSFTLTLARGLN